MSGRRRGGTTASEGRRRQRWKVERWAARRNSHPGEEERKRTAAAEEVGMERGGSWWRRVVAAAAVLSFRPLLFASRPNERRSAVLLFGAMAASEACAPQPPATMRRRCESSCRRSICAALTLLPRLRHAPPTPLPSAAPPSPSTPQTRLALPSHAATGSSSRPRLRATCRLTSRGARARSPPCSPRTTLLIFFVEPSARAVVGR